MKFAKTIPYKIKRILPMLGIAGASLFMGGCEKDEPITPTRDVELMFVKEDFNIFESGVIRDLAEQPDIRTVYLVPDGSWVAYGHLNIYDLVNDYLRPAINISPKVRGKGDFNFWPGAASLVPQDSLWITQQGWTINLHLHNQR